MEGGVKGTKTRDRGRMAKEKKKGRMNGAQVGSGSEGCTQISWTNRTNENRDRDELTVAPAHTLPVQEVTTELNQETLLSSLPTFDKHHLNVTSNRHFYF